MSQIDSQENTLTQPHIEKRRSSDALRAIDGLLQSQLQQTHFSSRSLVSLAFAMTVEYMGAENGTLLLDEGNGLAAVLSLTRGLEPSATDVLPFDQNLVDLAIADRRTRLKERHVAAPVLVGDSVRAILVLAGSSESDPGEISDLATAVAARVAALLRSTELVHQVSHQTRNVETLETLGALFSAGRLSPHHIDRAIESALTATASDRGVLGLLNTGGDLTDLHTQGRDQEELRDLGLQLARAVTHRARKTDELTEKTDLPSLFEPLIADLAPYGEPSSARRALGFIMVQRSGKTPFEDADRSFLGALAHLLAGSLARVDYLRHASEDPLTGAGSRFALQMSLAQIEAAAERTDMPFSAILLDVDGFKEINDTHGHLLGDMALKEMAATLSKQLRAQDFFARFGGDEFILLLPRTGPNEARHVAERVRDSLAGRLFTPKRLELTLSMGVATFPDDANSGTELLGQADRALYAAKQVGVGRITSTDELPPKII